MAPRTSWEKERERAEREREADELPHRHHAFADAVALFSSRSSSEGRGVLTRSRMALLGSLLVGHAGSAVFAWKASWD